jgi:hypothetical protein
MVRSRVKKKKEVIRIILYDCTPPDSEGHLGAIGCLSYLAATMTLLKSPILIPQLSYKTRSYAVYDGTQTRREKRDELSHFSQLQINVR